MACLLRDSLKKERVEEGKKQKPRPHKPSGTQNLPIGLCLCHTPTQIHLEVYVPATRPTGNTFCQTSLSKSTETQRQSRAEQVARVDLHRMGSSGFSIDGKFREPLC
jgi:hypothetical protein